MRRAALAVLLCAVAIAGCAKEPSGGVLPGGGSSPTPSPSPSAIACAPVASSSTVVIAMGSTIAPVNDPTYGVINGYAPVIQPQTEFFLPTTSAPIMAHPTDVVQFVNAEPLFSSTVRSAASLMDGSNPATAFPASPYSFLENQQAVLGREIANPAWSTSRIAADAGVGYCASQQFTLTTGTWYFGDLDTYNLDNRRDVIIVR